MLLNFRGKKTRQFLKIDLYILTLKRPENQNFFGHQCSPRGVGEELKKIPETNNWSEATEGVRRYASPYTVFPPLPLLIV